MDVRIEGITLPPVGQIGVVVKDVDKAIEYYQRVFGIGPFEIREASRPDAVIHGKVSPYKSRLAFAKLGPVELELIQIMEGETIQSEFLRSRGEGIHHLGFMVEDIDEDVAKLGALGIGVLQTHRNGKAGFAYMDTESVSGVIVELIHRAQP